MATVTIITSVLLAALTAVYVILTKRLLDASVEANAQSKELFRNNQRLQVYPHVSCHVARSDGEPNLVLQNHSDNAAQDVDVLIIGQYSIDDMPAERFRELYVEETRGAKPEISPDDEGFYGVYHHFIYCSAPPHRQVRAALEFPVQPDSLQVLLQFRDVLGNNYYRIYWLFTEPTVDDRFKIGSIDPHRAKTWSRVDFDIRGDSVVLVTQNGGPLPPECETSRFTQAWSHSLSSGHIVGASRQVEDPGEWSAI